MEKEKQLWWGYKHTNGHIQVKRYFEPLDIQEAEESPFCEKVSNPFEAIDRDEALIKCENLFSPTPIGDEGGK